MTHPRSGGRITCDVKISINIESDDAAFKDNPAGELDRILVILMHKIEDHGGLPMDPVKLLDSNGHVVGEAELGRK